MREGSSLIKDDDIRLDDTAGFKGGGSGSGFRDDEDSVSGDGSGC